MAAAADATLVLGGVTGALMAVPPACFETGHVSTWARECRVLVGSLQSFVSSILVSKTSAFLPSTSINVGSKPYI